MDNSSQNTLRSSWIPEIRIELINYKHYHEPFNATDGGDERINGRKEIEEKLKQVLINEGSKSGAYLVTGYRGVGKTSLVRKAIAEAKKIKVPWRIIASKPLIEIEISLAQDDLSEEDILRMIARQMTQKYSEYTKLFRGIPWTPRPPDKTSWWIPQPTYLLISLAFIVLISCLSHCQGWFDPLLDHDPFGICSYLPSFMRGTTYRSWATTGMSVLLWVVLEKLARLTLRRIGVLGSVDIQRRLTDLAERMESSVKTTTEASLPKDKFWGVVLGKNRERQFPVASSKDIQNELREILQAIDNLSPLSVKPRFVLVFDELDKARPQYNYGVMEADAQLAEEIDANRSGAWDSTKSLRKRQEAIAKILGGLKYFFNNAGAKFIFIAGRELYDAALADISDRDAFVGSIFDDVFYVSSFMKPGISGDRNPLTSLTEDYVCRYFTEINERGQRKKLLRLQEVAQQLKDFFPTDEDRHKAYRVLAVLHDFILYLNYRSNGTPKKITHLFEEFVHYGDLDEKDPNSMEAVRVRWNKKTNSNGKYLKFTYHDQFRIGLIARLFRPLLIAQSSQQKYYSDKILVATTFLLDHITKYHHSGFSWHTLEQTPELISALKTPDVRTLMEGIIDNLEQYSIRRTVGGLFRFKFRPKYRFDIVYVTKLFEQESAGLSFTLDESFVVKRHFHLMLQSLQMIASRGRTDGHKAAIAMVHHTIGDLHYYDQEFVDAIVHYQESRDLKCRISDAELHGQQIYHYCLMQLKIGLAYERMKDFAMAFVHYSDASEQVMKRYDGGERPDRKRKPFQKGLLENLEIYQQALLARLHLMEKTSATGISYTDVLDNERCYQQLANNSLGWKETEDVLNRAKYHLRVGIMLYFKNGKVLVDGAGDGQTHITKFLNDIAKSLERKQSKAATQIQYASSAAYEYLIAIAMLLVRIAYTLPEELYCDQELLIRFKQEVLRNSNNSDTSTHRVAKILAERSASGYDKLLNELFKLFQIAIDQYDQKTAQAIWGSEFLETAGELFTRLGDLELSRLPVEHEDKDKENLSEETKKAWEAIESDGGSLSDDATIIERTFRLYTLSAKIFSLSKSPRLEGFTYNKLLHLIHEWMDQNTKAMVRTKKGKEEIERIEKVEKIIKSKTDWAFRHSKECQLIATNYAQTAYKEEMKALLRGSEDDNTDPLKSTLWDVWSPGLLRESVIFRAKILRRCGVEDLESSGDHPVKILNSIYTISSMFERVQELMFRVQIRFDQFLEITNCNLPSGTSVWAIIHGKLNQDFSCHEYCVMVPPDHVKAIPQLIEIICDCIASLKEVVRILEIFGSGYIIRHSYLANAYEWLGDWCVVYNCYRGSPQMKDQFKTMKEELKKRIQDSILLCEVPEYYFGKALTCYRRAIDLHRSGIEYKENLRSLSFLEDDFGDQLSHFSAATERLRINSGDLHERCGKLVEKLEKFEAK